jgi:hypothetical protein
MDINQFQFWGLEIVVSSSRAGRGNIFGKRGNISYESKAQDYAKNG